MKYQMVVFDLDGTILNTLNDLANAVNKALNMNEMPERTLEEIRRFVGNGAEKLIRRAVPDGSEETRILKTLADFKAYYSGHSNEVTGPYDGIRELMCELRGNGIRIGVHSNKYNSAVQELCKLYYDGLYDYAIGEGENCPKKPDPTGVLMLMKQCGKERKETIYVGDSEVDLQTAQNAGVDVAWVSWGFRRREELGDLPRTYEFDHTDELKQMLLDR